MAETLLSISEIHSQLNLISFTNIFTPQLNSQIILRRRKKWDDKVTPEELFGRLISHGIALFDRHVPDLPWIVRGSLTRRVVDAMLRDGEYGGNCDWGVIAEKLANLLEKECKECLIGDITKIMNRRSGPPKGTSHFPMLFKRYSIKSIRNARSHMEDFYCVIPDLGLVSHFQGSASYLAVFDGHCGSQAATYASIHLHHFVADRLSQIECPPNKENVKSALIESIKDCDEHFCRKGERSGTTVAVVLLLEGDLYCAWLGDSEIASVHRDTSIRRLTPPHKPELERERIQQCGGTVDYFDGWRVNGILAVSRAIGSSYLEPSMSNIAEVVAVDDWSIRCLVLASDGLWDVVGENELREALETGEDAASVLVRKATERGSNDNITVIVLELTDTSESLMENGNTENCNSCRCHLI